jgi:hypothetical protein
MISKEEYIRLYCDDVLYKSTGVIALNVDKLGERMATDPIKTIRDLDDYGFSDAMRDTPLGPIESVSVLNTRTGRMSSIPVDGDLDALEKALEIGMPKKSKRRKLDFGLEDIGLLDPDSFDWGNEDMIP